MAQSQWTIVSYILMAVFLAMFGTIGLSRWITIQQSHGVTETIMLGLLLSLQVTTVILLFVFTRVNRTQWRYVPWRLSDTHGITIIGLTIFLIGTFVYDIFSIIATTECLDVYRHFDEKYDEKIIDLVLLIFKPLLYMSSQLLFLMWCNYGNIQNNPNIRKTSVFIFAAATNLFFWIYSFLFESKKIFLQEDPEYNITKLDPAIQKHANECLHEESEMQRTADNVEIYLYPVQMEFCILATSLLLHTWSHIKHSRMRMHDDDDMIDFPADNGDGGPKDDANGQHALIRRNNGQDNEVNGNNNVIGGNDADPPPVHEVKCYGLLWIIAIMLMTLMFTFECLLYVETFYSKAILIVISIKTLYDPSLAIVCAYVIYKLKKSGKMKRYGNIDTECVIMLISSLGLVIDVAFTYISVIPTIIYQNVDPNWANECNDLNIIHDISNNDESVRQFLIISVLSLVRQSFKLIQVMLQVYLIIILTSFYTGPIDNWLSECLGFILILNFGHWLSDSIVEVKFTNASPVQEHYFGCDNWLVIVHIFFTLAIYFRFHSVLMLSEHVRRNKHGHDGYQRLDGDNVQEREQPVNNNDHA
ncbi:unnamed protein product [Owenia fusiformis]|uniref:Uncharacterized protein n=1 Tax=Owenia fusiformis TaxID=6347 RepID=A0A8J1UVG5_OWEFU|nr:unnamed protein product [Owenia fusiformis]